MPNEAKMQMKLSSAVSSTMEILKPSTPMV